MTRKSKRLTAGGVVVAAALLGVLLLAWNPAIAPIAPPAAASFDSQTRLAGARVVALGDCIVCHTAQGGKPFAGGLPLATPFGTIYATNITPDAATGIGNWSLEAFTRAVRHGVARDGHLLYPAFPYIHSTRMSDRDVSAAYAYLMTREPVDATAPANALIFPLNFRPLLAFWNVLFLRPGAQQADASQDVGWNRGKLLVDGLGHCASCHSPLDPIGGEKLGHAFDGGMVDGWEAPALNALGAAPKPWTRPQLVAYLRSGRASEHGAAAGPMLPVTRDLATVPEEDVQAIATYILSIQKPRPAAIDVPAPATVSPDAQRGALLFAASCAQCHGSAAPMQSIGERPTLAFSTAVNAATPRNTAQMILSGNGWHGEDSMNYMPAFSEVYSDRQIADLASYLRAAYSQRGAWQDVEATVVTVRKENDAPMITLTVNGVQHTLDIDPSTPLLYALRNDLHLHGAKFGCGLGQCGACTVIVGDKAMFSCLIPVSSIGTRAVRTIESLGTAGHPGPLQKSFIDHQAAQCGYCIAGMIMRAQALLERTARPTERELREHMEPNLCRCGTHTHPRGDPRSRASAAPAAAAAPSHAPSHASAGHGGAQ